MRSGPAAALATARDLLRHHPLVDGHNDLPWAVRTRFGRDLGRVDLAAPVPQTHTDLPRLRRGGVGAQFWSVYVPGTLQGDAAVATTLEQIDLVHQMVHRHPDDLELALSADDVEHAFSRGRIASLLGAEGGHAIANSTGVLRMLHRLGVRYMTLTHNVNVPWADSATDDPVVGGLSAFGREVVGEMQRLGMLVDLSHVAATTARDVLQIAEAPVVFSHSGARAVCDHPRNVPDDLLRRLAANGGVCMVTFVPDFVSPRCRAWTLGLRAEMERRGLDPRDAGQRAATAAEYVADRPRPRAVLAEVADHVEHVRRVAGIDHVGIGGDYDGTDDVPDGLEDVACYPALIAELLDRGWSQDECVRLIGGNVLRVLREAEAGSRSSSARRGPSTASIADLDHT
ncbi:membrane dipeptidase [Geodermatophilus bullaregiensis]|uniref:dipeptidase n=1 Tax=Geodermatophilus bullaregiensis TaxID=1564160 RepID=UPI00195C7FF7|nr:dipeptidase [Geodermatophilus bullaregiensis]MBM7809072.1 membrane dipeptidase [Geodermatophilus bullaregiensis]